MNIVYREATLEDLDVLKTFEQGVIAAERPFNSSIMPDPVTYYDIAQLIESEDSVIVVAVCENSVNEVLNESIVASGYAMIRPSRPYFDHKFHAYLGFMYVHPDFRGVGINQEIIAYLSEWSQRKGMKYAYLDVYAENTGAIRAYEKAGFEPSIVNMKLKLEPT